jgi:hypothetical protein
MNSRTHVRNRFVLLFDLFLIIISVLGADLTCLTRAVINQNARVDAGFDHQTLVETCQVFSGEHHSSFITHPSSL